MRTLAACLLCLLPAAADTVVLKGGLRVHGDVREEPSRVVVVSGGREWVFDRSRVESVERGETALQEYDARAGALAGGDAAGWYRLGLWAREQGLPCAGEAFAAVLRIDPDHRAARRALGYEQVDGVWLDRAEAMRRRGFVLAGGRWVLPEEAERALREGASEAPVTEEQRRRAEEIAGGLADPDPQVRDAARAMAREVPGAALVLPLKRALVVRHEDARLFAVKTLGRIGDKVALPWILRASIYDPSEAVRAAAFRTVKGFRDPDVFHPYARAVLSKNDGVSVRAAEALAALGDPRGVDVILRRVSWGLGESGRAHVYVGKQQSYIQDFDVEIAQAAAIGDPIVQTIRDGVILDYKILGGHGEGWIAERRARYAGALASLVGRDYGEDWAAYARHAEERR